MRNYSILFIISSLRRGGAENHLFNLCTYLRSRSHRPSVCTLSPREDGLERIFLQHEIPLFRFPLSSLKNLASPGKLATLRRIVKRTAPDIVHSHLYHADVIAALASFFTGGCVVTTKHSAGLEFEGKRRWMLRLIRSRFESVIAVSEQAAGEALSAGYHPDIVKIIRNGVDTRRYRPAEAAKRPGLRNEFMRRVFTDAPSDPTLLIGSVGGLKSVKNYSLFMRIASRLIAESAGDGLDLRFVIIGEGAERGRLTELAAELGITGRFAMPGYCDHTEEIYPLFDLFVLPSLSEGVPMVILEAMSSAVPCVASDVGDVGRTIGDTGEVVRSGNEEGFVEALRNLLEDSEKRIELGRRARVRIMERYDIDAWGERMVGVYRDITG